MKYEKDFKHLSYVNPDAPKGGEISFWAFGSFDSMHPYTRKGRAGAYSSIFFESLLEGTSDEIDSAYGLIAKEIEDLQVNTGATTPVFVNEEERKRSITLTGKSVNLVSRSVTTDTSTNVTVIGLDSGATFNVAVTVKADPSRL